jgi:phosphoserine phosphatase RsbU/P
MPTQTMPDPLCVLDAISDGVYVTDLNRQIVYWSRSAEKITGWKSEDVVGRSCHDGILCHIDKDGHVLCGEEYCPLHRAIVSGTQSTAPIIVFAQGKSGRRVPMRVTVGPVLSPDGSVIGGVETFHDLSESIQDDERARKIQNLCMVSNLPADDRLAFRTHYIPRDIVGGDFTALTQLSPDRYGFLLADVSGHGVAAALYTMFLRSLWDAHKALLTSPARFAAAMSRSLCGLIQQDSPFAAALCGMVDLAEGVVRVAGAGNPPPLLFSAGAAPRAIPCPGLPLGLFEEADYIEESAEFRPGDHLLLFTDGATEITRKDGSMLEVTGLVECLGALGYPRPGLELKEVEEALLKASNRIRFDDDLTLLEIRR